jgi:phage terminase large subunit GpA-like protein
MSGYWRTLRPPPLRTATQWADTERVLTTRTSSSPGQWQTLPHQIEPLNRASTTDHCVWLYLCWGSQLGKSDLENCIIGYLSCDAPGPMLFVQPTLGAMKRYSRQRIDPMIEDSPALAERWASKRSRDDSNTLLLKEFEGGLLVMVGANTPSDLSSMPIRYVIMDEIDQYTSSAKGDGDPIDLAVKRTTSFPRRKIVMTSTPTYDHRPIWQRMQTTGWREFHVPCPHCETMQVLQWEHMKWEPKQPETAQYFCPHCGVAIDELHKRTMLPAGKWIPRHPELETGRSYGYHISTLYAPHGWTAASWGELAREYEEAVGEPEKMRVFVNTRLALPFDDSDAASIDPETLQGRAEVYARPVPEGVRVLTAGVDVQQDRVEVEVVGWGDGEESWSIDFAALPGDPTGPQLWSDLDDYLRRRWDGYGIAATCVDSGYMAQQVQDWCYHRRGRRVYAIKGIAGAGRPLWPKRGSVAKRGTGWKVWMVGVDTAKDVLWPRWSLGEPGPGYMHTPTSRDEQWYAQVLAERPTVTRAGRREWVRSRGVRSEALDCRVYAYAALCSLRSGGVRLEDIAPPVDRPAATTAARGVAVAAAPPAPPALTAPAKRHKPARSSWLDPGARLR